MAAPVIAPSAPPINAPEPVLFCCPYWSTQPVSNTAEVATAKIEMFNLVFMFSKSSVNRLVTSTANLAAHSIIFNLKTARLLEIKLRLVYKTSQSLDSNYARGCAAS
jgi:hypothetical protein